MPDYEVRTVRGGQIVMLLIPAIHENEAIELAQIKGYVPISAKAKSNAYVLKKTRHFPLALFSQELLALMHAGLNLVEAIEALVEKDSRVEVKSVLDAVLQNLYQGQTFSAALSAQPQAFPMLYVATVKASEKTGDLSESLSRYVAYELQLGLVKKKIISASIYPILLMVVGGMVILFLLGFVVPKFSHIYEDTGGDLPFLSQVLLSWGVFIETHGKAMLIAIASCIAAIVYGMMSLKVKKWVTQLFLRIPAIGDRLKIFQLARFYRTLGMLLAGGTPILAALNSVEGLLPASLKDKLEASSLAISEGQLISSAMESADLTTPVALRMLRVGERGGTIGEMMERIASFYDEELSRWIDWFTRLFEPLLMLFIGLVIGVVVLLLYMPIFELAGNIQ